VTPLRRLDHVLVLTDDLDATRALYCEVLGLEVGDRPPLPFAGYWLCLDGVPCVHVADRAQYESHAATLGLPVGPAPVDHVAFAADDDGSLAVRLADAGIRVTENLPGTGVRQLFLEDPNGLRVELNVADGGLAGPAA
jgi:catechol 2,3-dioxygenase-like lactoylglutathione lyase family enzyme